MDPAGFPHSDTHGSKPAFGYPWLFADRCVLHRLLVPRHSPCALISLTITTFLLHYAFLWVFLPQRIIIAVTLFVPFPELQLHFTKLLLLQFYLHCSVFNVLLPLLFHWNRSPVNPACRFRRKWWAQVDSNHRPCAYQAHALTT